MDPQHLIYDEITRLQQRLLEGLDAIPKPATLGVGPHPTPPTASLRPVPSGHYPVGHFGPQHGLTPAQAWQAEQLLRQKPPFRGRFAQQREAARIRGIITAMKAGRVANSAFGRSLHGHRGGKVMARALSHLRAIAPLGAEAAESARARKKALEAWERTGEPVPLEQQEPGQLAPAMDAWAAGRPFLLW